MGASGVRVPAMHVRLRRGAGRQAVWASARADGEPGGLDGLWNAWFDPATGEAADVDTWLMAPPAQASALVRLAPAELFVAGPAAS